MKGIVLVSHGDMAKGMAHSATFFMGDSIEQLEYCGLRQDQSPEDFAQELAVAIAKVDSGDGVIILADLFGGTPCNQSVQQLGDNVELIAGMNFPMLLELLSERMSGDVDAVQLAEKGRMGLINAKELLASMTTDDEDE